MMKHFRRHEPAIGIAVENGCDNTPDPFADWSVT